MYLFMVIWIYVNIFKGVFSSSIKKFIKGLLNFRVKSKYARKMMSIN